MSNNIFEITEDNNEEENKEVVNTEEQAIQMDDLLEEGQSIEDIGIEEESAEVVEEEDIPVEPTKMKMSDPTQPKDDNIEKIEAPKSKNPDLFSKPKESVTNKTPAKPKKKAEVVNFDSIKIETLSGIDALNNARILEKKSSGHTGTTQTGAIKSGYLAHMKSLSFMDTLKITNSNVDGTEYLLRLYETVYEKIEKTSIGNFSFDDFLAITAEEDLNHLLFGIFSQTYKTNNEIDINCGKCDETSRISFDHDALIQVEPEQKDEVYRRMFELLSEIDSIEMLREKSMINEYKFIKLPDSGMIFALRIPTLKNSLEIPKRIDLQELVEIDASGALYSTALNTEVLYIPNFDPQTGEFKGTYSEESDIIKIINNVQHLSKSDGAELLRAIAKITESYKITYAISGVTCGKCGYVMNEIPVDMMQLLFRMIQEDIQG